jgi:hypothetical protein
MARFLGFVLVLKPYNMSARKLFLVSAGILAVILISPNINSFAQENQSAVKDMIESQHYTFKAQSVNPASGRTRQLTTDYTLKVSKDTVIADLPYFGRAYTAPINPADGGINFTSANFDYAMSLGKKNSWEITIKPKDHSDVQELTLTVFENGNADLRVVSTSRQFISYSGYIAKK